MTRKQLYTTPTVKLIEVDTQELLTGSETKNGESIERGKLVDFDFNDPLATDKDE